MDNFMMGTVFLSADGKAHIRPDGEEGSLQKPCLLPAGMALAEGDRVLVLKFAGCRLVIGRYPKVTE